MFNTEDYNYELPSGLIAQVPKKTRDRSRLLVVDPLKKSFEGRHFFDLPMLLRPGDLLVVNDTRVVPARLFGRKESGGRVEILVLEHPDSDGENPKTRACLVKSSKRPKNGSRLFFEQGIRGHALLEEKGHMPLPPYIKRGKESPHSQLDRERYQTVYSEKKGAIAAPTAGLHFTRDLIERLK